MASGTLTIHLHFPGCTSLKEKRSRLKPILARLHKEFNVSTAEVDLQDRWQETIICCAIAGSDRHNMLRALQDLLNYIEKTWPDEPIIDEHIEIL